MSSQADSEFESAAKAASYKPKYGYVLSNAGVPFEESILDGISAGDLSYRASQFLAVVEVGGILHVPISGDLISRIRYSDLADNSGSVLSVSTVHSLVDGQIYFSFVAAWAALYRLLLKGGNPARDLSVPPLALLYKPSLTVFPATAGQTTGSVSPSGSLTLLSLGVGLKLAAALVPLYTSHAVAVHLTRAEIDDMKAGASTGLPAGEFVTSNDVVVAHLWRAQVLLRGLPMTDTTRCVFFCNMRKRHPRIPGDLGGGCIALISASALVKDVISASFQSVVLRIHQATQATRNEAVEAELNWIAQKQADHTFVPHGDMTRDVFMSSWAGFEVFGADFAGDGCASTFFLPMLAHLAGGITILPAPPSLSGGGVLAIVWATKSQYARLSEAEEWKHQPSKE